MKAWDLGHIITDYVNSKGDAVSPKKLQKLLYYVEAWNLVHIGSIVDEDFEAWVHGPVIPDLYHKLKGFGFNSIAVVADESDTVQDEIRSIIEKNKLDDDRLELIYSVLNKYSSLSSLQLEILTHNELPWIEARAGLPPHEPCKNKISKERMKAYYSGLI